MAGMMVVFGTRPEAIKLVPVVRALRARGTLTRICITGQHRDLLDRVLGDERIEVDFDLDLMRPGATLAQLTGRMIAALGDVFARERPDRVIVQGDTATALAAAQAAYLTGIPVAHVEAGLRTGDLANPHPEEGNRRMIAALADLHFAPTRTAAEALLTEGADPGSVHVTGNTAVDALASVRARLRLDPAIAQPIAPLLTQVGGKKLVVVTCHRRESFGPALSRVLQAVRTLAAREDVVIAFVLHPNPVVRQPVQAALTAISNVVLLEPLDFAPFVALLSAAHMILTDSGGVQEEAPVLGLPVLLLRDHTERPEGVEAGTTLLVGTHSERIVEQATRLLDNPLAHTRMARKHSPYGNGRAASRISAILTRADDREVEKERRAV
jgi:UDP-N-acetylglucosamine 2-epimerase (non-hydrolysing)